MNIMVILGYYRDKRHSIVYRLVVIDGRHIYQFQCFDSSWQNSLTYYYGESKTNEYLIPIPSNEVPK